MSKDIDGDHEEESTEKLVAGNLTEKMLISTGIRVGTLIKTKSMDKFVSRTRPDGLHVIDFGKTLARIDIAGRFIARFEPKRVVVFSSREYSRVPIEMFCKVTGAIPLLRRFMPGTFTNPLYSNHIDPEVVIVSDPSIDFQAVNEASKIGIPVVALCDTDNITSYVDLVIPANNRGRKALAAVFWLLSRAVLIYNGSLSPDQTMQYAIDDFETKLEEGTTE